MSRTYAYAASGAEVVYWILTYLSAALCMMSVINLRQKWNSMENSLLCERISYLSKTWNKFIVHGWQFGMFNVY